MTAAKLGDPNDEPRGSANLEVGLTERDEMHNYDKDDHYATAVQPLTESNFDMIISGFSRDFCDHCYSNKLSV